MKFEIWGVPGYFMGLAERGRIFSDILLVIHGQLIEKEKIQL